MTKKRRTSNRSKYINYQELEQYGLGSYLSQSYGNTPRAEKAGLFGTAIGTASNAIKGLSDSAINYDDTSMSNKEYVASYFKGDADPASILTNQDLSFKEKVIGGLAVPGLGGVWATKAQKRKVAEQKRQAESQQLYQNALGKFQSDQFTNPMQSYTPVRRCGGRLMAYGGEVPPSNGDIYNYSTGYSGQQLAPHSELTGTIQEITIPRYRYATNNQPSGYYRTMTTRNPEGVINTREFTDKGWEDFLADPYNTSLLEKNPRYKHLVTPKKAMGGTLNYDGQYHSGPDGGVPVDGNGNPNATNPVALVEKGEVSYRTPDNQTYIFSNTLNLDKNKTFAKEAKRIQSRYKMRLGDNMTAKHDDIAMRSYQKDMNDLMQKQELVRNVNGMNEEETPEFKHGGGLPVYAGDEVTPTGDITLPDWMRYTPEYNGTEVMPQVDMSSNRYNYSPSELGIDYTPDYTALGTSTGTQQGTTSWKPYSGMNWGSAAGLAAPIIGNTLGLINNRRNRNLGKIKVDASTVTPQRVNLERERASAREQANLARANARRALREGTTPAQYLANVGNTEMGIQRGLGQQLGESYQREEALNAQMRENAMARNDQNRYMKMQADIYNSQLAAQNNARRQQYMNNMPNAVNQWNAERERSKQNAMALNMMHPDYTFMEAPENPNTWWGRNFGRRMYSKQANQYYNG